MPQKELVCQTEERSTAGLQSQALARERKPDADLQAGATFADDGRAEASASTPLQALRGGGARTC